MSKGAATRERILEHALRVATRDGLEGLTIGALAEELGMSKSGLFAHFGSKEDLQLAVLKDAAEKFESHVIRPSLEAPKGLPQLEKLFDLWLDYHIHPIAPGGCIFIAASTELDDHEGKPRDFVAGAERYMSDSVVRLARSAIEAGQLRKDLDVARFAYQVHSLILGAHHFWRLLRDPRAEAHARASFQQLLDSSRPSP
ncbi:TetR/AcrR family transcriptional regulator [Vitiosangium sp. GDMCC 1.1324]|uniref:TetR/AcrR family transcriptional regulator n=1 Tax=Vitiosangium sp. (strain GDMCC 1.1324) TaxID=2138576 RepID=UPI000D3C7C2E|nr:TetR/AcrR family transcriptional regulator [Vitiosangium sp. GDMCC 1.1324]PTL83253.1 TetR family transcriptional regulator [Vitiosangium sp. GDMCC 1.1324]